MSTLLRRSQSLGVAIVVLAMTATVAFAAADVSGGLRGGLSRDQTLSDASAGPDDSEAPESEAPESEAPESEAPESEAPDGSQGPDVQDPSGAVNHGDLVSTAANMDTPAGFPNHGAFVSCVAQMPHDVDPTTFDWTTVTPDSCGLVSGVGTTDHGHGNHHGWASTHRHGRPTGG
ncbi:MAG TPA: hypothetical protein VFP19_08095 [Candidatus Limnocylindrales bacterium]|nr:hypothetical protein [Candidatus Limnocylindrales bacterium]